MSHLVDTLLLHIRANDILAPVTEYRFAAELLGTGKGLRRRLQDAGLQDWRFDLAWPDLMLAAEVDGATWAGGRHTRGKGYEGDCRKVNAATVLGWRVLRFTGDMVESGEAVGMIQQALMIKPVYWR